jgi:hypothetical protein
VRSASTVCVAAPTFRTFRRIVFDTAPPDATPLRLIPNRRSVGTAPDGATTSSTEASPLMHILLHSDTNTDGSHLMSDHLEVVVKAALDRFGERITRVEAHLSDVNGESKSTPDDIHCTLEARLVGLESVVVKDHAGNAHQAIDGAVRKLKRAVGTAISRHDPRSPRNQAPATARDAVDGTPE